MPDGLHPLAPHVLPPFISAPGEPDVLFTVMIVVIVAALLIVGSLYLQLHSLPERMAHRANRVQLEIVAVLCLLALFTHQHLFWVAALLLALIQIPDFSTPLARIADSLERPGGGTASTDASTDASTGAGSGARPAAGEGGEARAAAPAGPQMTQAG